VTDNNPYPELVRRDPLVRRVRRHGWAMLAAWVGILTVYGWAGAVEQGWAFWAGLVVVAGCGVVTIRTHLAARSHARRVAMIRAAAVVLIGIVDGD
jgi:hypothetical protein